MSTPPPRIPAKSSPPVDRNQDGVINYRDYLSDKARASKRVAWLLDECVRIPGTKIRFGIDPVIGMLPFGGETVATIIGTVVLGQAGRRGIPFKTLVRMGGNMILNAGLGTIPVVGDLFSVWFKSNSRNYRMMADYLDSEEGREAKGGWGGVFFVFLVLFLVVAINVAGWLLLSFLVVMATRSVAWPWGA